METVREHEAERKIAELVREHRRQPGNAVPLDKHVRRDGTSAEVSSGNRRAGPKLTSHLSCKELRRGIPNDSARTAWCCRSNVSEEHR